MMKIALYGASGQVGSDCHVALTREQFDVVALTRQDADFSQPADVLQKTLATKPDLVINCCAYTAVDKAESEQSLANAVNHLSVAALANACRQLNIPLMHISTDYVFDGTSNQPYQEDDPVSPLGTYGETKLSGEQAIIAELDHHIILRTSWVFGEQGNNFVKTMLRVGAERDQLNVVNDQHGRPTYVGDIVSSLLFLVNTYKTDRALPWGIYHCSSEGETTWYDFACEIFRLADQAGIIKKPPEVLAIPSSDYPTPAPRPNYSVLNTTKLQRLMGRPLPHWQQGLSTFLSKLY